MAATFDGMISIEFSNHPFKIETREGREMIFDGIRKKWLVLTPEEWVRQNFLQYLVQSLHYPPSLIGLEKEMNLGELKKRFDIVVHNRQGQPWMLVECKAMDVPLSAGVAEQALRYNQILKVAYLVVTNGAYTRCFQLHPMVAELEKMPKTMDNEQ